MMPQSDHNREEKQLKALLNEDFGEDAERYLAVVRELRQLPDLAVNQDESTHFARQLRQQFAENQQARKRRFAWRTWLPLILLRTELQLMRTELWIASILVTIIGVIVTSATYDAHQSFIPFVHVAPVLAAIGVAFVFNLNAEPPSEIILSCVVSFRLILLSRLTLIFCLNLILGILGSLFLVLTNAELSLWPLIMAWVAPMSLLSALAFFLAILTKEPLFGAAVSLILWVWEHANLPSFLRVPITISEIQNPVLLLLTLCLFGAAIWLAGKSERWIGVTQ
jgi:hypothetical protein